MNQSPSPTRRLRWLPYVLGVGLVVALGFGLRPRPAPVETALATSGPLRATVSEEGKTRIKQRYVVSSPVTGQLRRVPFKPGAAIAAGDVVAVIEPMAASPLDPRSRALAEARRDSAVAALEQTRAAHALAINDLKRAQAMFDTGTLAPQDLDAAKIRETVAAREVVAAEGALRAAETELAVNNPAAAPALVEVRAPVAGRVLHVFQESERPVTAGTPLLDAGDPADLEVVIELLSRDGAALAPGARVALEQWGGPKPLDARVRLVEPAAFTKISALGVEEQRVNVVADIITPLTERPTLGDNFRVEARVIVWESEQVLKVPVSALFRRGGESAAYVVRGGRAVLVPVEAGRSSGSEVQVLKGLTAGDEVILYPGDRVSDGQRVQPVKI
ncbi:efflux RND transporter periplasmic adaptor subunit [Opitutus sp. GAS368]|uniref:efflux RND transporter periplasmic adaptor subunit n=1 Tax=Opitutus sp. GAS368 TaxID=1882749 RepID=UPI00087AA903|nr:efflux RND transporter periplasmic adaptor subunit [Opitutus sp. GAS368]SDR76479.1 HlyD family secretion protein [Opitutus sp. GAS368]